MKRLPICLFAFIFIIGTSRFVPAQTVVNFDDVTTSNIASVSNPYMGFNWYKYDGGQGDMRVCKDNWYHSTYSCSITFPSQDYAAYGEGADSGVEGVVDVFRDTGTFDFVEARFAAHCYQTADWGAKNIRLTGYHSGGGTTVKTITGLTRSSWTTAGPYTDMTDLTQLRIEPYCAGEPGCVETNNRNWIMDNFTYETTNGPGDQTVGTSLLLLLE